MQEGVAEVLSGLELIAEMNRTTVHHGEMMFWWLGQHSVTVKLGETIVYVDPYLSESPLRLTQPLVTAREVTNAHLVIGTHDHGDHIDRDAWGVLATTAPEARFVLPDLHRERVAAEIGIPSDRLIGVDDGQTVEVAGLRITGVAAAHEFLDQDPATGRYPYLGYVVEGSGCTFYHAGDTCLYNGIHARLEGRRYDVVFLPINGRDAVRLAGGCIGNMTYQEAADLAGCLEPRLTVPTHFDMFEHNSEDPLLFVEYMRVKYPHLRTAVPTHGARMALGWT